ncbi:uncharacterized protein UTRI_06197_B [Ustilago trichophora]|uniref:Effector family protein Eff1 n=1 Tax=Ustilago trichophora TaxID=86804 RepID=A0A5C3EJM0_9BASI|nr:uncharacterized protein UTRI_06197_B [Ustilago trichophora]
MLNLRLRLPLLLCIFLSLAATCLTRRTYRTLGETGISIATPQRVATQEEDVSSMEDLIRVPAGHLNPAYRIGPEQETALYQHFDNPSSRFARIYHSAANGGVTVMATPWRVRHPDGVSRDSILFFHVRQGELVPMIYAGLRDGTINEYGENLRQYLSRRATITQEELLNMLVRPR